MTRNAHTAAIGALLMTLILAGCSQKSPQSPGPTGGATRTADETTAQIPPDTTGAALASRVYAKPFQVDFRAVGPVKKGENTFVATVTRGGKPVTDATVKALLTMPAMKMFGSEVTLEQTDGGRYEGTANLAMAGDWQANVSLTSGASTVTAVYDFRVQEPTGA